MLPREFKPAGRFDLTRLGRQGDGGYLVDPASVQRTRCLIGMGLSTDWSFEQSFVQERPVPVDVYDHTVTNTFWGKRILSNLASFALWAESPAKLTESARTYAAYRRFFRGDRRHYRERIGRGIPGTTTLRDALARRPGLDPYFLKIDIEGAEYLLLQEILDNAALVCGLVIEFHGVPRFRERIVGFIKDLPLELVHVHPNNYSGANQHGVPRVLEMTFSQSPAPPLHALSFPHELDRPNSPKRPDVILRFESGHQTPNRTLDR